MLPFAPLFLLLLADVIIQVSCDETNSKQTFEVDYNNKQFLKDGEPFTFVAGEIHYFRVPRFYWRDRLSKLKAAGCNTVTTYVEWSFHEPKEGEFRFDGDHDLIRFLCIAQELNLTAILRPGPYICAEREFGGFPYWLLRINPEMQLRTNDTSYTYYVEKWFNVLFTQIKPLLYGCGGNIIMIQVENEYGSYPINDKNYTIWLKNIMEKHVGNDAVLFTTDGFTTDLLTRGTIPGVFATVDFGPSDEPIEEKFDALLAIQPNGPLVNSELYTGWISYWGRPRAETETQALVNTIVAFLQNNVSFSMYMFHGGTNFGFTAGSGSEETYLADITSYDYDAPVSEAGDLTPKYIAIRDAIMKSLNKSSDLTIPIAKKKGDYGEVKLHPVCSCFSCPIGIEYEAINGSLYMEAFDQGYGFISYTTLLQVYSKDPSVLRAEVRDRAIVYLEEREIGVLQYTVIEKLPLPSWYRSGLMLRLFIENMGRRNFKLLSDCTKGIVRDVTVDNQLVSNWTIKGYPLSAKDVKILSKLSPMKNISSYPIVYRGVLILPKGEQPLDTFISMENWGKGVVFVNGHNIGRYWKIGPQKTLYVPRNYLKKCPGKNIIIVFELHYCNPSKTVTFVTEPKYSTHLNKSFD